MPMRSAFDIASYLLSKSREVCIGSITPLKLQKLLYYSQAWSLVLRKKRLFREDLEAWIHGPVVPHVYQIFKRYGFLELLSPFSTESLELDETRILDEVLKTYGMRSAKFLENLSHSEYPWVRAREGLSPIQKSRKKISLKDMMIYYSQFLGRDQKNKINPLALQIKKMRMGKSFSGQFLSGMGAALDVMPASSARATYASQDFSSSLSDVESSCSDWEKVGGDIQSAFGIIERVTNEHK
jgi:uncharacterized phage-associated protein